MAKKALITGVTGQDGSYLAEFLMNKGYDVHGTIRRSSVDFRERIAHLEGKPNFHLHYADMGDSMSIMQVVAKVRPDEIYNLAAQSHVQVSFDAPEFTADVDAVGVLRVLEAVRLCDAAFGDLVDEAARRRRERGFLLVGDAEVAVELRRERDGVDEALDAEDHELRQDAQPEVVRDHGDDGVVVL